MKEIIIIIILSIASQLLLGQNDSTNSSGNESETVSVKNDRMYKLFLEQNDEEIKQLFKLNIIGLNQLAPLIAYEHKLGKSFSSETSLSILSTTRINSYYQFNGTRSSSIIFGYGHSVSGYQMFKYYYNLNRRERLGKNINGFSGNYFAVQVGAIYIYNGMGYLRNYNILQFDFTYGIQRKIGNIGFIEPSVSLFFRQDNYDYFNIIPTVNLEMGFSFESFSKLDRILK
ncbi:MAG: hypothetical protein JXA77_10670 [Bacteroidales bacterium]|nr:hypothetical protein [Bacteroidales bacterium]MBN2820538.1 hypothetical protein [Bacteroidales bacterium]